MFGCDLLRSYFRGRRTTIAQKFISSRIIWNSILFDKLFQAKFVFLYSENMILMIKMWLVCEATHKNCAHAHQSLWRTNLFKIHLQIKFKYNFLFQNNNRFVPRNCLNISTVTLDSCVAIHLLNHFYWCYPPLHWPHISLKTCPLCQLSPISIHSHGSPLACVSCLFLFNRTLSLSSLLNILVVALDGFDHAGIPSSTNS